MKTWGAVIIVAGTFLMSPTGAAAKRGFFIEEPATSIAFSVRASNGYRVAVFAGRGGGGRLGSVDVVATKGRGNQDVVTYLARGKGEEDGAVHAKLPGVGRIAVRFRTTSIKHEAQAENCRGRSSLVRHGVFRGAIELHGEQGYTTVDSRSAKGTVTQSFRVVCNNGKPSRGHRNPAGTSTNEVLFSGIHGGSRGLTFMASLVDLGPEFGGPSVTFTASSTRRKDGLSVISSVNARGTPGEFSLSEPASDFENATVEPPPPFRGSATFHLTSPTSSTWEGNLETELPGVGRVALAGPGYWSALCSEKACTKTLPPNVQVIFQSF